MPQSIIPFHILIGPRTGTGTYPLAATFQGITTNTFLELPATLLETVERLTPGAIVPVADLSSLGRVLGRVLFSPDLRDALLQGAQAATQSGARLQLQLQIAPPELAVLPWESITIGASRPWSPGLHDNYAIMRLGARRPVPQPVILHGPLRILAAATTAERLQLIALEQALQPDLHADRIELRLLRDVTPATLEQALLDEPVHILHYAAETRISARGIPYLAAGMYANELIHILAEAPMLRLLTLAGPQGDAGAINAATPLLAARLTAQGFPAILTFGAALPARLAAQFAAACYTRLAEGDPLDLAVTDGRRELARQSGERAWGWPQARIIPGVEHLFVLEQSHRPRLGNRLLAPIGLAAFLAALLIAGRTINAGGTMSTDDPAIRSAPATAVIASASAPSSSGFVLPLFPAAPPTPTLLPVPTQSPTIALAPETIPQPTRYATYMTSEGDTPGVVAARLGSDPAPLAALNRLDPQAPIRAGRPLVAPVYYEGESGAGGLILAHGNQAVPKVALTFDIEIDDTSLYGILEILRARNLKGTFFVTGNWVKTFPDAARAIVNEGHEIANHSLTHPFFSTIGLDGVANELNRTEEIVRETTGATTRPYFRFPYGDSTPAALGVIAQSGYVAYHWSADDSAIPGWLAAVTQNPASARGAILLMHGRYATVASLPGWLDQLAALGLQPTTLSDVLR